MDYRVPNCLHILLIISFISMGISPACAFISGDIGFIEICAADGSIKSIKVSDEFDPLTISDKRIPKHKSKKPDCNFCFANTAFDKYLANYISVITRINEINNINNKQFFSYALYKYKRFQPRAPPISFT